MPAVRVLFVEDEALIRMMVSDLLRDEGFEVTEARDGDEAITLLDSGKTFDALFTDVRMPGTLDGIDVALRARRQHPNLPLLIASGYADELTTRLGVFEPAAVFLNKPYRLGEAADMLRHLATRIAPT